MKSNDEESSTEDRGSLKIDDLFYQNSNQVEEILHKFIDKVLPYKQDDKPLFSEYRLFNYAEELKTKHLNYHPQEVDSFLDDFAGYFENSVNWDSVGVLYNIHPNLNVYAQIASFVATFANPNFAQDISSGRLMLIEKEVIKYLSDLVGWNSDRAGGLFTFGGKSTNLYALKIALDKVYPDARLRGVREGIRVISTEKGHPSQIEACNWLGIGSENCIRLKTTNDNVLSLEDFKVEFESIIRNGQKLPLIYLNGFTTLEHAIDSIKGVYDIRNQLCNEYDLDYVPHIHVESVIGWVYLFLAKYNFNENPLGIPKATLKILKEKYKKISEITYADSFGADFHKTGFCSYSSSVFVTKDKKYLHEIERSYKEDDSLSFSQYSPYSYSLELSRPSHGPVSALAVIRTLGIEGFVRILAQLTESFLCLKDTINAHPYAKVLNYNENSNVVFFIFKPYSDLKIEANMNPDIVEQIKEFNTNFYKFVISKLEKSETSVMFSCSRSHKYLGQSFGSIKLYSFNSKLTATMVRDITGEIFKLFDEYINGHEVKNTYNIFDFLDVKGVHK